MNSIQAEYIRQAMAARAAEYQQQAAYMKTNPMPYDAYAGNEKKSGGGFFLKVAALATAVIFRKNIANVAKKLFPNLSQDAANAFRILKDKFMRVKGSGYVKTGWDKYVNFENSAKGYINEKLATETGQSIVKKTKGAWDWLKGLILK